MLKRIIVLILLFLFGSSPVYADIDHPINDPATGLVVASRLNPPPPPPVWPTGIWNLPYAPFGLSDCQEMRFYADQFGLPLRFDAIGWRESNCRNEDGVHTSCCWGYWQMSEIHFRPGNKIDQVCGADSIQDVNSDNPLDKQRQACATKQLFDAVQYTPWKATT